MNSNYIITALFVFGAFIGKAQQESQFANTSNNPYYVNAAAGGLYDVMQFEATYRSQWMGYNGGPRTMMVMGNSQIRIGSDEKALKEYNVKDKALFGLPKVSTGKTKHIVGGRIISDAIGPFNETSVYGSYAIHLPFINSFNFGAGIGLGWSNFRVDQSRVVLYQDDDNSYNQFLGASSAQNILDVNAGLVFYNENLFVGLSTSQVLNNKVKFDTIATGSTHARHYFVVSKYRFNVGDAGLEPSVIGKITPNAPMSFDIGARFIFNNSTWLGLQYRTSNAMVFQIGSTIIKNLYLGYSYEHAIGAIQTANNGSHEIQLGIYLGNNRNIDKEIKENKEVEAEEPTEESAE